MFEDILGRSRRKMLIVEEGTPEPEYMLLKDEGFSKWFECLVCGMKFEADASGMNTKIIVGTGPTGRGRRLEPACPKCEPYDDNF